MFILEWVLVCRWGLHSKDLFIEKVIKTKTLLCLVTFSMNKSLCTPSCLLRLEFQVVHPNLMNTLATDHQKLPVSHFHISYQNSEIINLRAHYLVLLFFENLYFKAIHFLKVCPFSVGWFRSFRKICENDLVVTFDQ